ncbi:hypothetical protein DMP16_06745 [Sulfolobus sp. B1]|uniref:hypothetical protein n=1 Tax=Sulfolobus sp. B1 TaxID=2200888 RepID=UPI00117BF370|nr:hypothetical protein [Sulfolobus sp. B1]TRM78602.1 hypothetical protein DJ532_00735 [Sulfolobus sp. A20-N-F8]TRM82094.1 hypothetical protein DJ524_01850 [Sulfolobus sp. D5]TRM89907.1 hypothetical protein DJ529_00065 [Sulfolobus sp. C3]TRM95375.1 hypothetical protein DJ526_00340 [Sulfolobus sp. A20-N-G8]TRM96376.1 hypothetical protein DMP16_06745 [Sulfolobus sp. B1]
MLLLISTLLFLSIVSTVVSISYSILVIKPSFVKTLKALNGNRVYSNPNWDNGTAIVIHNITYEMVEGLGYAYAVQNYSTLGLSNFTYSVKYVYFSGLGAGAIVLAGNVDLKESANKQPYVLIYCVTSGEMLVKTPSSNLKVVMNNLPISVSGNLSISFTDVDGNLTVAYLSLNNDNVTLAYITPIPWAEVDYVGWLQNYGYSYLYYLSSTVIGGETYPVIAGETYLISNIVSSPNLNLGPAEIISSTKNYEILKGTQPGDYLVEEYNVTSLNSLIVTMNFTYYNGSEVGIELLGKGLAVSNPDLQQVYGLIYAINNGELYVKEPTTLWQLFKSSLPATDQGVVSAVFLNQEGNVSLYEVILDDTNTYILNITTPIPWSSILYVGWRVDNGVSKLYFMPQNYVIGPQVDLQFVFLSNNGASVPNQKYLVYIGSTLSNLNFYTSGLTNSSGAANLALPIIYSNSNNYEYVKIVWVNTSTNFTIIIPLIQYEMSSINVKPYPFTLIQQNIDVSLNLIEVSLFVILLVLVIAYPWWGKRIK